MTLCLDDCPAACIALKSSIAEGRNPVVEISLAMQGVAMGAGMEENVEIQGLVYQSPFKGVLHGVQGLDEICAEMMPMGNQPMSNQRHHVARYLNCSPGVWLNSRAMLPTVWRVRSSMPAQTLVTVVQ